MDELQKARFEGFASTYNLGRPGIPIETLRAIVGLYLPLPTDTVVDVGAGTGLSTFPWTPFARRVVGVEPNPDMRAEAQRVAETIALPGRISFVPGEGERLPFADGEVSLLTCSQSFHWMEPEPALREFARVLAPGGVAAIYDCDWPPIVGEGPENAFLAVFGPAKRLLAEAGREAKQWPKSEHLGRIQRSGLFRFSREICFHEPREFDVESLVAMIESQGAYQQALRVDRVEMELQLAAAREATAVAFGAASVHGFLTYRLRLAIV